MKVLRECAKAFGKLLPPPKVSSGKYVPSAYNFPYDRDERVLFNTLTRCVVLLSEGERELLNRAVTEVDAQQCEAAVREMIRLRLLVPQGTDERKLYQELYEILYLMQANRGKTSYKIFTTTACNARCFYCFEQGIETKSMSEETADEVFEYIMKTKQDKELLLYWFGGEPLCNTRPIDRICAKLEQAGVPFTSRIVTNGLLFTEELVLRAVQNWKLKRCQITLDGMHEEYKRRKNYQTPVDDPLEVVLRNIELVARQGVRMDIRLNFDSGNMDSILELKEYIVPRFRQYENVSVYPAPIVDEWLGYSNPAEREKRKLLLDAAARIRDDMEREGLETPASLPADIPMSYCMANDTRWSVIAPDGKLYVCQSGNEELCYGDVRQGITKPELYETWMHSTQVQEKCRSCVLLPECTAFHLCPGGQHNCYSRKSAAMNRKLRAFCEKHKEQMQEP